MQGITVVAILPWHSPDAEQDSKIVTYDSQDVIDMCLSCRCARCSNCVESESASATRSGKRATLEELKELLDLHKRSPEICEALHISRSTFTRYKAQLRMSESLCER